KAVLEFLKDNPDEVSGTSPQAISVVLRKLSELAASQAASMFGEPAIDLKDAMAEGRVNVLNLADVKDDSVSAIAAAFLLYKLFNDLPEVGETARPKLVFFLDEAHVLFQGANKSLVELVVKILRRIRSKGVGVFFMTQDALDLPSPVLKLLGTKIQFAMRAFTRKGLGDMKAIAESFPESGYYDVREEIKSLPAGESFVSILGAGGESLAPVRVAWFPPRSFMDAPDEKALHEAVEESGLGRKYAGAAGPKRQLGLGEFLKPKPAGKDVRETTEGKREAAEKGREKEAAGKWGGRKREAGGKTVLRSLWVLLKGVETALYFILYKPLKWLFKWVARKPARIKWVILFLLVLFALFRYWPEINAIAGTIVGLLDKIAGRQ
ncbi:MAG: DUF853 family protein, partial [Candidatus Micrarchaeota archaeon]|nr:DUF853 family protein [Candidatus Micrarchaeota archaeon]